MDTVRILKNILYSKKDKRHSQGFFVHFLTTSVVGEDEMAYLNAT